ncbi:MAG: glyoxalase/bleomycin resistance/extradiol dioxygenase family protein [Crocinitomix sp.]|nr:glyoxalase/bleomycin resistance/extradiol dioxygenase family protein [Crocinitomix sp.]
MQINLLVIRSKNPADLAQQYEQLGMEFSYHKHGNGPYHYAAEFNGQVFEIYPITAEESTNETRIRLGFEVENIEDIMELLSNTNWIIIKSINISEYGRIAVIQDLDGRKIELKNK